MNFYQIEIARPGGFAPTMIVVQATKAPPLEVIMKRLLLDATAEIRVRQINVVTWEL